MRSSGTSKGISVGDLRTFLEQKDWSPEDLARHLPVSNMTWRRLLARRDAIKVPEKYASLLAPLLAEEVESISVLKSGFQQSPEITMQTLAAALPEDASAEATVEGAKLHLKKVHAPVQLRLLLKELYKVLRQPLKQKARLVAVAALAYFINPFDLIADAVVGMGLIDDLGILITAVKHLRTDPGVDCS